MKLPSMVVIFTNLSTMFTLAPELDEGIFNIDGIPYCPPRTPQDREWMEKIKVYCKEKINEAIAENYSIIIINNTPLTFDVLKEFHEKPNYSNWLFISFFHKNTELEENKIQVTDTEFLEPDILLDIKTKDMERLEDYPYIKKIFIPHGFQVTLEYLQTLFVKNQGE